MNNLFRQMLICEKKIHQIKLDSIQDNFNQNEWIIMNFLYEVQVEKVLENDAMKHPGVRCLAEMMQCTPPMISKILRGLEKKDMITRSMDQQDKRNVQVTLTEFGKGKVKEGRIVLAAYTDQIVKRFGEEKLGQIIDFMNEFYEVSKEVMNDMNAEDQKKKS